MMREIPKLQTLCLRAIGSHSCSVEDTFATTKADEPSNASRLLRSFHQRPVQGRNGDEDLPPAAKPAGKESDKKKDGDDDDSHIYSSAVKTIPLARTPCIGKGSARRDQANDIDLNHPIIGCRQMLDDPVLVMEYGNVALDCLQSYIDSLVELGRMDDTRLGVHFFDEWKANVILGNGQSLEDIQRRKVAATEAVAAATAAAAIITPQPRKKKRRRSSSSTTPSTPATTVTAIEGASPSQPAALGTLSLYNCTIAEETISAMVDSTMGDHLGILDLTGVNSLTDDMLRQLLPTCPNLERVSIKNCRRLSSKTIGTLQTHQSQLIFLDVGGSYNIHPQNLIEAIPHLPALTELHASGLAWTNDLVQSLMELRDSWTGLSMGFTPSVTATPLKDALVHVATTLQMLALPFCETMVDNALLGMLGRNLPHVICLDVRGNSSLNSLTGWYDGRASADLPPQHPLTVLARYSGVSKSSLEETKRIHPLEAGQLVCILDGSGVGLGLRVVVPPAATRGEGEEGASNATEEEEEDEAFES